MHLGLTGRDFKFLRQIRMVIYCAKSQVSAPAEQHAEEDGRVVEGHLLEVQRETEQRAAEKVPAVEQRRGRPEREAEGSSVVLRVTVMRLREAAL